MKYFNKKNIKKKKNPKKKKNKKMIFKNNKILLQKNI